MAAAFLFSSFTMKPNGTMAVDRAALHASDGYRRQVAALNELRKKREEREKQRLEPAESPER